MSRSARRMSMAKEMKRKRTVVSSGGPRGRRTGIVGVEQAGAM
jgi:hypothetical protein|tara:strand:- start:3069 stop:3197 length:129 start_codon:yes stop_codon:yes gene_type:complete